MVEMILSTDAAGTVGYPHAKKKRKRKKKLGIGFMSFTK